MMARHAPGLLIGKGRNRRCLSAGCWARRCEASRSAYFNDHIYHVPNGGQRNKKTASDLKRQGVRAGVSDLQVRQARGGWHGLYLEFKATPPKDAALAPSQFEWLEGSEYEGYCSVLARGIEEAKAVLREYASWPRTEVVGQRQAMVNGTEWRKG